MSPWLGRSGARAEPTANPLALAEPSANALRFVGVFTPHGCAHELWQPGEGFDLGYPDCSLAPFDAPERYGVSFKDRLLVLDGVDLTAGIEVGTVGHDAARVVLTGAGSHATNPSLDQYLAVECGLGAATPHTSLCLAVGNERTGVGANLSYGAGGTPIPKLVDPVRLFDELFGAPLTGARRDELAAQRARGVSALDFVRGDLARWSRRAPVRERQKLEHHATALREIEKRLNPIARHCPAPARPDATAFPRLLEFGGGEPYFDVITDLQIALLARALACDLTRFATLYLGDLTRSGLFPELPSDIHNDVAHRYDARDGRRQGSPASWRLLGIQNRYSYSKVARLMQHLDESLVLDDTILYVSSDMGDPARHSSRGVPTLVAGGSRSGLPLGRYIDLRERRIPNNRILVSIARAFGLPIERYGSSANSGTVTGTLQDVL